MTLSRARGRQGRSTMPSAPLSLPRAQALLSASALSPSFLQAADEGKARQCRSTITLRRARERAGALGTLSASVLARSLVQPCDGNKARHRRGAISKAPLDLRRTYSASGAIQFWRPKVARRWRRPSEARLEARRINPPPPSSALCDAHILAAAEGWRAGRAASHTSSRSRAW